MSTGKGYKSKSVGFRKGTAWGTAVVCTTNAGLPILSESISRGPEVQEDLSLAGNVWGNEPHLGNEMHEGTVEAWLRYGANCDKLIAFACGTATTVSTVDTGYYRHTIDLADEPTTFFTLAVDKDTDVWEYDSCMARSLTIGATAGDRVTFRTEMICRDLARNTSGGTNNNTTKLNITTPYASNRGFDVAYFSQARVRISTAVSTTMTAANEVYPSSFELTLDNNLSSDFLADDANPKLLSRPGRAGIPKVTGWIEFPERTSQTYDGYFFNKSTFKMDWLFTSDIAVTGVNYYKIEFQFPYCRVINFDAPLSGPDRIVRRVEFQAFTAPAARGGIDTLNAFRIYWYNGTATALI